MQFLRLPVERVQHRVDLILQLVLAHAQTLTVEHEIPP